MQAYGLSRSIIPGGALSTLLQSGIKTIPPSQPKSAVSGIKGNFCGNYYRFYTKMVLEFLVLENVTLNSTTTAKLIQNKSFDLSKVTLINSAKGSNTTVGNVFLLPDGKLKTIQNTTLKGSGGTPIILPVGTQKIQEKPVSRKFSKCTVSNYCFLITNSDNV